MRGLRAVGELEGAPALFRFGAVANGQFICHGLTGQTLSCNANGHASITELSVADTQGIPSLVDMARDFGVYHAGFTVSVIPGILEEELSAPQGGTSAYDAYSLLLGSPAWQELLDEGRIATISGSELLSAVLADVPARMQAAITADGELLALPVESEVYCLTLNVAALQEVAGISRSEIPTNWMDFLQMLSKLADNGVLVNNADYTLYDDGVGTVQLRLELLQSILQDAFLWAEQDEGHVDQVQDSLASVLEEFNNVDWARLGLADEEDQEDARGDDDDVNLADSANRTPLLSNAALSVDATDVGAGTEFWPLSLLPDGERLTTQMVAVLCVNPQSSHADAVVSYLEHVWKRSDVTQRMNLCTSLNEPVPNASYEDECAYLVDMAGDLERSIAELPDSQEKEELKAELEELNAYAREYQASAKWVASKESISAYRSAQDGMVVCGKLVWDDVEVMDAVFDFLDGELAPRQLIETLALGKR